MLQIYSDLRKEHFKNFVEKYKLSTKNAGAYTTQIFRISVILSPLVTYLFYNLQDSGSFFTWNLHRWECLPIHKVNPSIFEQFLRKLHSLPQQPVSLLQFIKYLHIFSF